MSDYYALLQVEKNCDDGELKKAYRKMAMMYHPDRNSEPDAEARFKEITEAYEVLRDPQKRAVYDRYGEAGLKRGGGGAQGFHHFDLSEALNIFMRDFGGFAGFEEMFGGGRGQASAADRRGNDLRAGVRLTMEDVAKGAKRQLKYKVLVPCEHCGGNGAQPGKKPQQCATCGGAGQVKRAQRSVFGQFVSVAPCPTCHGEGHIIKDPCEICRGDGRIRADRTVTVDVPPGVSGDNYITLRGQGHAGPRGGAAGDLVVTLEVEEDDRFIRHNDDLVHDVHLSFSQAALGVTLHVPTPWGDESVKIEPGTQAGTILRLRGRGLPHLGSGKKGDLHVRVGIWTPERMSPEMEKLFKDLSKIEGAPPASRGGRSFWDRMKEALGA
jgi:molecular chaperone DnaJ